MKKFLITVLRALAMGGIFGFIAYKKFNKNTSLVASVLDKQVYAFQTGVFSNYDNALNMANKYNGIVVPDNTKYRVYIALSTSQNSLSLLENYFDNKQIAYYIKNIDVDNNYLQSLEKYENLLMATTEENYQPILNNIVKEYQNTLS